MSKAEKQECMVDLETLGNRNKAVILSIGACKFSLSGDGVQSASFEVFVKPESCVEIGMELDASTVMWWMAPERGEARDLMVEKQERAVHIRDALWQFRNWLGEDIPVWGNGATFDNVILRNAYELAGIPCPWMFWNDRCYRTVKNLASHVQLERQGMHHSAMWDAISQAVHLQQIFRTLNKGEK